MDINMDTNVSSQTIFFNCGSNSNFISTGDKPITLIILRVTEQIILLSKNFVLTLLVVIEFVGS